MTNFVNAATAVADARLALDDANSALSAAAGDRNGISQRIAALETERCEIVEVRQSGHQDDEIHGARLAIIAVDLDDLRLILAEAEAQVTPLREAADKTRQRVSAAEQALATDRQNEVLRLLKDRATQLGDLLLQAVTAIESHKARLQMSRNIWEPSAALAEKIHKLHLTRV
jgi:hypothetical protein